MHQLFTPAQPGHDPLGTITLSKEYRIRPLDHLQWVLERKDGTQKRLRANREGSEVWRPVAYCRTKAGLETALSRLRCEGIHLDPSLIAHLPDYFPKPGGPGPHRRPAAHRRRRNDRRALPIKRSRSTKADVEGG
jgi:hypothetical protein